MNFSELANALRPLCSINGLIKDCDMSKLSSFKCGGKAAICAYFDEEEKLSKALILLKENNIPFLFLGNGSNVLFSDNGYKGVVIKLSDAFQSYFVDKEDITAASAMPLIKLSRIAMENSLTGLEFASGIPGSLGGGIYMNAGAYGGELSSVITSVRFMTLDGQIKECLTKDLQFSYRHSLFMENKALILGANLHLQKGDFAQISQKVTDLTKARQEKQPLSYPSAGSFFKRPKGYFAGKLIEDAGLKGLSVGGAEVSSLHAGFIINKGNATASDVLDLMKIVQERVFDCFGVLLEPEVQIIGN